MSDPVRTAAMAIIKSADSMAYRPSREQWLVEIVALDALRAALALPVEQPRVAEPVAEVFDTFGNSQDPNKCIGHVWLKAGYFPSRGTKLYASPSLPDQPAEDSVHSPCASVPDAAA